MTSSEIRSTLNRLAGVQAGQEQLQAEVAKVRSGLHTVLILQVYFCGLAAIVWLALRYGIPKAAKP